MHCGVAVLKVLLALQTMRQAALATKLMVRCAPALALALACARTR